MSGVCEQAPQGSGQFVSGGSLFPWEGAGVGRGQAGNEEGQGGAGSLAGPCPFVLAAPPTSPGLSRDP